MARLFGLIANQAIDFHLKIPKTSGPFIRVHGWGIGGYKQGKIYIQKGKRSSINASQNSEIDTQLSSDIIIAHARVATSGAVNDSNLHPFFYKNYLFAHNGTVNKEKISALLREPFNKNFQSEPIDSEVFFRLIVQNITDLKDVLSGIKKTVAEVKDRRGTNFIMSDGKKLYAYCFGLPLYFLRRRPLVFHVATKETGIIYQSISLQSVSAFLVCAEKLTNENWIRFDEDELVVCDKMLNYDSFKVA